MVPLRGVSRTETREHTTLIAKHLPLVDVDFVGIVFAPYPRFSMKTFVFRLESGVPSVG